MDLVLAGNRTSVGRGSVHAGIDRDVMLERQNAGKISKNKLKGMLLRVRTMSSVGC